MSKIKVAAASCTLLVDGNNLLFRAWYAAAKIAPAPTPGVDSTWFPAFIALRALRSYAEDFAAKKTILMWDTREARLENFRQIALHQYKAGRQSPEREQVFAQMEPIKAIAEACGIRQMNPYILEADDVIAWLSENLPGQKVIVSNDTDLLQLVSPTVRWYNATKKKMITVDNFQEEHNCTPEQYIIWKAMRGDVSDNIPAVDIEAGLAEAIVKQSSFADLTPKQAEQFQRNLKLMDLQQGAPCMPQEIDWYATQLQTTPQPFNPTSFTNLCQKYSFASFLKAADRWKRTFSDDPT